jgi:hypothetical protein
LITPLCLYATKKATDIIHKKKKEEEFPPHFLGPFTKLLKKNRKKLLGKIPDDSIAK